MNPNSSYSWPLANNLTRNLLDSSGAYSGLSVTGLRSLRSPFAYGQVGFSPSKKCILCGGTNARCAF